MDDRKVEHKVNSYADWATLLGHLSPYVKHGSYVQTGLASLDISRT
jgi:hypothetical protein